MSSVLMFIILSVFIIMLALTVLGQQEEIDDLRATLEGRE